MLRCLLSFSGMFVLGALAVRIAHSIFPPVPQHNGPTAAAPGEALARTAPVTTKSPGTRPSQPALAEWWDFLQTLDRATLEDLPALWDTLPLPEDKPSPSLENSPRHRMLIERWTQLDPVGAIAFIQENAPEEPQLYSVVFAAWAQSDPQAALASLRGEPDSQIQNRGIAGFLLSFAEEPNQLMAWARRFTWVDASQLSQDAFARECPDDLFRRLLAVDRAGMHEFAGQLPPWFREQIDRLALLEQTTTDLPSVLATLKQNPLSRKAAIALAGDLGSLAASHPDSAIAVLETLLAASDGTPLLSGEVRTQAIGGPLVKHLAASDPEAAVAFISRHLDPSYRFSLSETIYPELFASNPAAALVVARVLPFFPAELLPLPSFKDRQTALEVLPDAPPSWRRDQAMQHVLDQWMRESPGDAKAWLDALPAGEWRERASVILAGQTTNTHVLSLKLQEITLRHHHDQSPSALAELGKSASQAAQADPAGTLEMLGSWAPGPAREFAIEKAAVYAAGQSTAKALEWVQKIPDPIAQAEAVRGVLGIWTAHEPQAASEWLPTLAPGPVREAAVDRFAETIASLDPAASLAWATTLTDPAARTSRLETTFRRWAADDPVAAEALANIPGLSSTDVQHLLAPPAPDPE